MLRVVELILLTALFLCISSCTPGDRQTNAPAPTTAAITPTPTPATTPPPTTPLPTAPTTASVKGSNFKWVDDASGTNVTTIKVGGTVTWTKVNGDHTLERVAGSATNGCDELDASFDADDLSQPVSRTFNKVGTFGYHCGIHGGVPNCKTPPGTGRMPGIIKVVP